MNVKIMYNTRNGITENLKHIKQYFKIFLFRRNIKKEYIKPLEIFVFLGFNYHKTMFTYRTRFFYL